MPHLTPEQHSQADAIVRIIALVLSAFFCAASGVMVVVCLLDGNILSALLFAIIGALFLINTVKAWRFEP